jgi:carbamoyltransferase
VKSKNSSIILGVNGWYQNSHDASIAIVEVAGDSVNVLVALEEERVTRNKHAFDTLPTESLEEALDYINLNHTDIDHIVFGWDLHVIDHKFDADSEKQLIKDLFKINSINSYPSISYIPHHKAHAASVAFTSEVNRAIILVLDGQGESCSSSAWLYESNKLTEIANSDIFSSLGYLYDAVSSYVGFTILDAGKTMGLAAYGEPVYADALLKLFNYENGKIIVNSSIKILAKELDLGIYDKQIPIVRVWRYIIKKITKFNPNTEKVINFRKVDKRYANLAASVQKVVEIITNKLISYYTAKHNCIDVCLSGGLALNCKSNGVQLSSLQLTSLYIQPAAGDAGVSLGAALAYCSDNYCFKPLKKAFLPFLGTSYTDNYIIEALKYFPQLKYSIEDDAVSVIASLISKNMVVGLFNGRCEWGPRALGNRSIVCRADDKENIDYINKKVKHRELGRPLGPSLTDVAAAAELGKIVEKSYYMTVAHYIKDSDTIRTSHIDSTIRPQIVTEEMNMEYYRLLVELRNTYSIQAVINTSFNDCTPIVHRPEEAIQLLLKKQISAICFNSSIVVTHVFEHTSSKREHTQYASCI